jgi:hypothetical protein
MTTNPMPRVIGLHRVPFDDAAFDRDCQLPGHSPEDCAAWREQMRENWNNAWIVVIEYPGPADKINFSDFGHGSGKRENRQAAWEEKVIIDTPERSIVAFFLHYVDRQQPLWYRETALTLPKESAADPEIVRQMPYCSPD